MTAPSPQPTATAAHRLRPARDVFAGGGSPESPADAS
jgi:hypothetical protein